MDWLRHTAERLLGIAPARPGEDAAWRLRLDPFWPDWVLLLFAVAAAAFVIWIYQREGNTASTPFKLVLAAIRLALVALALLMLSEAVLSVDRTGLPYAVVMVDDSASMALADRYDEPMASDRAGKLVGAAGPSEATRLSLAKAILFEDDARLLRELGREHKVRLYSVSSATTSVAEYTTAEDLEKAKSEIGRLEAAGQESRLGAGLHRVLNDLRGSPPSVVLLLTDGQNTDGESLAQAADYARRKNVPVYAVGVGSAEAIRDLELRDLLVDDVVFVDDVVNFEAKLTARGYAGRTATVRLREKGGRQELAAKTVEVPADGQTVKVRVPYQPTKVGDVQFVLQVVPFEKEVQQANNTLERQVSVKKEKVRVLLVEGYARWEFRYLKNLLEREPTIDLRTLLLEADDDYVVQDRTALAAFPTRAEDLSEFDVLIVGDVNPAYLGQGQMQQIAQFVARKGGGLIQIAGERHAPQTFRDTPLEAVLPIELAGAAGPAPVSIGESFQPELTVEGRANPIFRFGQDDAESMDIWRHLPGFFWFFEAPRAKPGAVVLATHPTRAGSEGKVPIFVTQFAGAGKVLFLASPETWRWRFRVGDAYFGRFWVQSIRYLARSKLLGKTRSAELVTDRRQYQRGEPVAIRVRFVDESLQPAEDNGVRVMVERKGHEQREVMLKRVPSSRAIYEGNYLQAKEGSYHLWVVSPSLPGQPPVADFDVQAPPGELANVRMNEPELRRLAERTEGRYFNFLTIGELLETIPEGHKVPLDTDPPLPLWNTWPVLGLFMVLLLTEWLLRKRKRML